MKISKNYSNVFEALEDNPAMAQNLKIRADLMNTLRDFIADEGLNQKKAAESMGFKERKYAYTLKDAHMYLVGKLQIRIS